MKLAQIAQKIGCSLQGNPDLEINSVATLMDAQPNQLAFLTNKKYAKHLKTTQAAAVIIHNKTPDIGRPALRSPNPYLAFAKASKLFYQPPQAPSGIHPTAIIADNATIGPNAAIGPYVVIGERVTIGANAIIHPHTVIYHDVHIGDNFTCHAHVTIREKLHIGHRVLLQSSIVIGADGFGFAPIGDGHYHKIPQAGSVHISDDVEIQSLSSIDRGTLETTHIGHGVKIDNHVQIGHGSTVGQGTVIAAQVGLSGSTTCGKHVVMGGQSGTAGHMAIGDATIVAARAGITNNVKPNSIIAGFPHMDAKEWRRMIAAQRHLTDMAKTIRELKTRIENLEN